MEVALLVLILIALCGGAPLLRGAGMLMLAWLLWTVAGMMH